MPQVSNPHSNFVFSREEIELKFEKIEKDTLACKKCNKCFYCQRAEFNDFEQKKKIFLYIQQECR